MIQLPKNLSVGLVGPLPPPSGGMANQTHQLARLLRIDGVGVEIIQTNLPYRPIWIGKIKGGRAVFRLIPYLFALWTVAGRVDLLHIMANSGWSWHLFVSPAVWIARLRGKPVIINYRGGGADVFFEQSFWWVRKTINAAQTIVVPSGFLQQVFKKWKVPTRIIPNIIDFSRFSSQSQDKKLSYKDGHSAHIIVTRNLEKIYDIATAIRAYRLVQQKLPSAKLTVAGSGPQQVELEALVTSLDLGKKVTFTGRLDNDHMAKLYHSADVMVNPSTVDNMPNSVLEALACGVPVVSTDVGGIPYILENGKTAIFFPVGDDKKLAESLMGLLTDDVFAQRLSAAGHESVQQYAWPQVKLAWLKIYQECIENRKSE
ncbi:glycosyltransferase family 4 protein [Beggiatoa alba]|nr:glycosyltransferase family 4 protein [Beggiatoa alba]